MPKKRSTKPQPPYAAYICALLLGAGVTDPDEVTEALGAFLRVGLRPKHMPSPLSKQLLEAAIAGATGEALRGFALAEGWPVEGWYGVLEDEAYKFRSRSCPGNWAQAVCRESAHRTVVARLEKLVEGGPAALEGFDGASLLQDVTRQGSSDLFSGEECYLSLERELGQLDALRTSGQVLATGYPELDGLLECLLPGDVTVVAARTSVGKTKFALNVAEYVVSQNHPVHVYSLEMSRARVMGRLWSIHTTFPTPSTLNELSGAAYGFAGRPIWVCDTASLSAGDIVARVRYSSPRPKLVAVDYLGLLDHGDLSQTTEASAVGKSLKTLRAAGRELGYHLLLLAQINRAGVGGPGAGEPDLHHLRGSGDIEQDADHILMLGTAGEGAGRKLVVKVAKNRNTGKTGKVYLRQLGDSCKLVPA